MANEILTTLHPENDENTNLYPNIKRNNIPDKAINLNKVDDEIKSLLESSHQLTPSGTDTSTNILAYTENKGIYIGTDTGYWYYWDGTQYVSGGEYIENIDEVKLLKSNIYKTGDVNYLDLKYGYIVTPGDIQSSNYRVYSNYFLITNNSSISFPSNKKLYLNFYDVDFNYLGNNGGSWITSSPVNNLTSYFGLAKYCRVVFGYTDDSEITNIDEFEKDIVINSLYSLPISNEYELNKIKTYKDIIIDVNYEAGTLDVVTGEEVNDGSLDKARSEYISICNNSRITFYDIRMILLFYDKNYNYLGRNSTSWIDSGSINNIINVFTNAKYFRILVSKETYTPIISLNRLISVYGDEYVYKYTLSHIIQPLKDKTLLVIGDSISDETLTTQATIRYFNYLEHNDLMKVIKDGRSGTGYVRTYGGYGNALTRINNYTFTAPDYCVFFLGTNDWFGDTGEGVCQLGQLGDSYESGTFYGIVDYTFLTFVTKYPSTSVLIALPIHRAWETSANGYGNTLMQYVNAIRELAHKYSFIVVDLYNEGGINPLIMPSRIEYFTTLDNVLDGTHPNNKGHLKLYPKFKDGILKA